MNNNCLIITDVRCNLIQPPINPSADLKTEAQDSK